MSDEKAPPLAPQGSKDYVAGQPVDEEEQKKTEDEAAAKRKAAEEAARKAEHAHDQPKVDPIKPPDPKHPANHSKR